MLVPFLRVTSIHAISGRFQRKFPLSCRRSMPESVVDPCRKAVEALACKKLKCILRNSLADRGQTKRAPKQQTLILYPYLFYVTEKALSNEAGLDSVCCERLEARG